MNAELAELTGLASVVADAGRFVAAHIRSRDFRYVQAAHEMLAMVEEFRRRRTIIVDGLNSIPGIRCPMPAGAFSVGSHARTLCD
jgi:aspartate/methionine/tyrosine aminotransferase